MLAHSIIQRRQRDNCLILNILSYLLIIPRKIQKQQTLAPVQTAVEGPDRFIKLCVLIMIRWLLFSPKKKIKQ